MTVRNVSSGMALMSMVTMVTTLSISDNLNKRQDDTKSTDKATVPTKSNAAPTSEAPAKTTQKSEASFANKGTSTTKSAAKSTSKSTPSDADSTDHPTTNSSVTPSISTPPSVEASSLAAAAEADSTSAMIGAIVSIVLIIIMGFVAFLILRRKKKKEQNKERTGVPDPFTMGYGNNDPIPYSDNKGYSVPPTPNTDQPDSYYEVPMTSNKVPMPSVNKEGTAPQQTLPSLSIGSFVVIATYIPTLSDELEIEVGDQVQLLSEYDDGWCQGMNISKGYTKGVFPRHCIDYASIQPNYAPGKDFERSKRISSMNR